MFKMNSWKKPRFFDLPNFYLERPGQSEGDGSLQEIFDKAKLSVNQGVAGDVQAAEKALEVLADLRLRIEVNNLVEAYYGCAMALLGREDGNSQESWEKAMEGLRILDEAVSNEPDNTEIRTLRGSVSLKLPETVFHRTKTAIEDFNYLAARYELDASVFSEECYWQVLYDLGAAHNNLGEAREAESIWNKLLSLNPDGKYKDLINPQHVTESDLPAESVPGLEPVETEGRQDLSDWFNAWENDALTKTDELPENDQDNFILLPADDDQETNELRDFINQESDAWGYDTRDKFDIPPDDDDENKVDVWAQDEQDEIKDQVSEEILSAVDIKNRKETFLEGFRLYELALAGYREATRAALRLWEEIYQGDPQDTIAQAYYGGCLTLEARNAGVNDMTFRNTAEGLKLVRAVEREAGNLRLRYLRAYLTYNAPDDTFRMNEQAIEDFVYLKQTYEEDTYSFDTELYHQILYDLGLAYMRANELEQAKEVWSQLLQVCEDPKYKELLEEKGQ